jgi:hypothetical protein
VSMRTFAERDHHNIVSWNRYEGRGGHYAAHLATETLVEDVRSFFDRLR